VKRQSKSLWVKETTNGNVNSFTYAIIDEKHYSLRYSWVARNALDASKATWKMVGRPRLERGTNWL